MHKALNMPSSTYYKYLNEGRLLDLIIDHWLDWQLSGVIERPWSASYVETQSVYARMYLSQTTKVSAKSLEEMLRQIPPKQYCKRKALHSAVSSLAKWLVHYGELPERELKHFKRLYPKKPRDYRPKVYELNGDQVSELCKLSYTALFLSETGLRISEFADLQLNDLHASDDPTKSFIEVQMGKFSKYRQVPYSKRAPSVPFKEILKYNSRRQVHSHIVSLRKQSSFYFTAHSFRHYRATLWYNHPKIAINTAMKWLGHDDLSMVKRYTHVTDEVALQAAFE